jgi:hypothetical protein
MRPPFYLLTISIVAMACGQSYHEQKELDLKEKKLIIKEKELQLKTSITDSNSLSPRPNIRTSGNNFPSGNYTVKSENSYFHNSADEKSIRKSFLVKGDIILISKSDGDFAYGIYTSATGKQVTGWVLCADLEKSPKNVKPQKPSAKFLVTPEGLVLLVNKKAFMVVKGLGPEALFQETKPNELASASIYGTSGGTTYSASLQQNGDIIVRESVFYRAQGELNTESQVLLKIKAGNY